MADFTGFHDFPETLPLEDDVREITGVDPVSVAGSVVEVIVRGSLLKLKGV